MDIIVTGPNHGRHAVIVEKKIWIDWYPLNKRNYNMLQDEPTLLHSKLVYDTTERLKKYFLRKWPLDWTLTIKKFNNFVFCQKIQKKTTTEDQWYSPFNDLLLRSHVFLTIVFKPLMRGISSYMKDTNEYKNKIHNFLALVNLLLVTIDSHYIEVFHKTKRLLSEKEIW